jgi:hypothetical protein
VISERYDYLLEVIERASEALAALVVAVEPAAKADDELAAVDRALDDLLAGLDAHAHRLAPESVLPLLRADERALAFALLQTNKGLRLRLRGDPGGPPRLRCARGLLALLAARPGRAAAAAAELLPTLDDLLADEPVLADR